MSYNKINNNNKGYRDLSKYQKGDNNVNNNVNNINYKNNNSCGTSNEILTKQLVGSIYTHVDLSKFRYELIQYESELNKLLKYKYFVSLNFCGTNCLLVFTKIRENFYCFTVDRQTLSYNFSKVDFSKINIDIRKIALDDNIYNGTVFDGILIKRHNKEDMYVICDVYKFCGENMVRDHIDIKLLKIREYLKYNYDENLSSNNLILTVNKLYPIGKIDIMMDNAKSSEFKFRGISFYPEISETKLLYMIQNTTSEKIDKFDKFEKNQNQIETKYIKVKTNTESEHYSPNTEKKEKTEKIKYINMTDDDIIATLEVKSTENPDVYKLYCVDKVIIDKKTKLKKISMGIAHIKGIECSHKLKNIFTNKSSQLMICKFNNDTNKWEPLEINIKDKIPTFINEIEEKLTIIEDSDD